MGLGLWGGGVETAKFLLKSGCEVRVTDLKKASELKPSLEELKPFSSQIEFILGEHRKKDFEWADVVVHNPKIRKDNPFLKTALQKEALVLTPTALFSFFSKGRIIAITGTKGKSTTASLISHLLKSVFANKVFLGGNIGVNPLRFVSELTDDSFVVLELSSWQIENLQNSRFRADMIVFTNIDKDHLNTYKDWEEYVKTKLSLRKHLKPQGEIVANLEDPVLASRLNDTDGVHFFALSRKSEKVEAWVEKGWVVVRGKKVLRSENFLLPGAHNLLNLLAGLLVVECLGVESKKVAQSIKDFQGLEGRLEKVAEIKGRVFVNDTCATNPLALLRALESFDPSSLVLITGGTDKNLDFKVLHRKINRCKEVIFLPGTATEKLKKFLQKRDYWQASTMREAVFKAWEVSETGDVILLSPGSASFGLFVNEKDRGERFKEAVREIDEMVK